jgi:hypothetical protein
MKREDIKHEEASPLSTFHVFTSSIPGGGNRTHTSLTGQRIFVHTSAFAAPRRPSDAGSWSGLCLPPRLARVLPVESLHVLLASLQAASLGVASPSHTRAGGSPNLRSSTSGVTAGALNFLC